MSERHSLGWRGIMPHYHKYEWEGFNIEAKPRGIRRIFKPFPYLTGSEPKFKLTIKTTSGEPRPLTTHVQLFDPTGKKESWKRLTSPDKPIKSININLLTHPVSVSGDHYLQAHLILHEPGSQKEDFLDIITFRAIAQEIVIMWAIGILVAVGATILNVVYKG